MHARHLAPWTVGIALVVGALYGPVVPTFFIADDLCDLLFVRDVRAPFWHHLDPTSQYTDATTRARFMPVSLGFRVFLFAVFGMNAAGYHLVSLALHVACAMVVGLLAWRLFGDLPVAGAASVLFAALRVNGQAVGWIAAGHLLLASLLVLLALWCWIAGGTARAWGAPLAYAIAALTHPTALVFPALVAAHAAICERRIDRTPTMALAVVTVMVLALQAASLRSFPTIVPTLAFSWERAVLFLTTMVVPFEAATAAKLAATLALLACVVAMHDVRLHFLFAGVLAVALFWSLFPVGYPLAPRYFYLAGGLYVIGLVGVLRHVAIRFASVRGFARLAPSAFGAAVVALSVIHAVALMRNEVVWFQYLAEESGGLYEIWRAQPADGTRRDVAVVPFATLPLRDRAFFEDRLRFVPAAETGPETVRIQTAATYYMRLLGRHFGRRQWLTPWLPRKLVWTEAPAGRPRRARTATPRRSPRPNARRDPTAGGITTMTLKEGLAPGKAKITE